MLIGVISDTHGLLRPRVFDVFAGVDRILHAGDVGRDEGLLIELAALAPVDAVHGNTDRFPLCQKLPESLTLELEGVTLFLAHICGGPAQFRLHWPALGKIDVVVFGHTHKPFKQWDNGVLFFNPGAAGPRRFSLPVSVGILRLEAGRVNGEIITLEP